ncbi:MAG: phosphoenolpyruvate carboxylase [Chthoniobacterales bacterium]
MKQRLEQKESQQEPNYLLDGFKKIDRDLHFLMLCFQEVLEELGEHGMAASLPWLKELKPSVAAQKGFEQAYSIAFQLLNIVEANAAEKTRRLREISSGLTSERGLWGAQLLRLKNLGFSPEEVASFLQYVRVEPVFTAHPTEAKRGAVLEQHRILHQLLAASHQEDITPLEKKNIREEIKIALEKLWRSGEIFLEQPKVSEERRGILFYFRSILPEAIDQLDHRLESAWEELQFPAALIASPESRPRLDFGTWVGGDRDGHPFVTTEVTRETLEELRLAAVTLLRKQLDQLARALPLSIHFQQPSEQLCQALEKLKKELGFAAEPIMTRYPEEPWRQFVLLIQAKLPSLTKNLQASHSHLAPVPFKEPREVQELLKLLARSLEDIHAERLVKHALWPILRSLNVFGFHLAHLDIRQNSQVHDLVVKQILEAAQIPDADSFLEWDESKRLTFLRKELASDKSLLKTKEALPYEATHLLSCYQLLRDEIAEYGVAPLGSLIVSMTRRLSDLLMVIFLAREGGITGWNGKTHYSLLPIVPLFETYEDLEKSPQVLRDYLAEPSGMATIEHQQEGVKNQQVMIGYSDSNKDCGILASQWILHESQRAMTEVGKRAHVKMQFFHCRGGTISRGAGPTHLFLEALPAGSLQGDLRMTEQGETIAQKYGNQTTATYHLELLLAGVTSVSFLNKKSPKKEEDFPQADAVGSFLATKSRYAYQAFIHTTGFLKFYEHATPIDALEASRIGSRPKRRSAQRCLAELRAIPWVFSWNQARYFLPGWFGVGSALSALERERPDLFRALQEHHRDWSFLNYVFLNVETNLASANLSIMEKYAELVSDITIRTHFFSIITKEFQQTKHQLYQIFGGTLEERRPRMGKTLDLRAKALDLLHEQQIITLKAWRKAQQDDPTHAAKLLPRVLLSINAIASGLRTTG